MQLIVEANGTVSTMAQGFLVTYYKISSGVLKEFLAAVKSTQIRKPDPRKDTSILYSSTEGTVVPCSFRLLVPSAEHGELYSHWVTGTRTHP